MITQFSAGKVSVYPFIAPRPRITEILLGLKFWKKTSFPVITKKKERSKVSVSIYDISFCGHDVAFHAVFVKCCSRCQSQFYKLIDEGCIWDDWQERTEDKRVKRIQNERSPHVYQLLGIGRACCLKSQMNLGKHCSAWPDRKRWGTKNS